jgi:hypothetical protein
VFVGLSPLHGFFLQRQSWIDQNSKRGIPWGSKAPKEVTMARRIARPQRKPSLILLLELDALHSEEIFVYKRLTSWTARLSIYFRPPG